MKSESVNPFIIESPAIPVIAGSSEIENKKLYAEALLRDPLDAHSAARKAFPNQFALQTFAFDNWRQDPFVLKTQDQLLAEHGAEAFLPSKEDTLHEIYFAAKQCRDMTEKLRAYELAAKIRGHVVKDAAVVNNNTMVHNVLQIPEFKNDEAWEESCIEHQTVLREIAEEQQQKDQLVIEGQVKGDDDSQDKS